MMASTAANGSTHRRASRCSLVRLSGLIAVCAFWIVTVGLATRPPSLRSDSLSLNTSRAQAATSDCKSCHAGIDAEWRASTHAAAATNERFLASMEVSGNPKDCLPCHAPQPVLRTGLANPVLVRSKETESGVTCAACHEMTRAVAASREAPFGPCNPLATNQLTSDALCGVCHRSIYIDTQQARSTGSSRRCVDCHMRTADTTDADSRVTHRISNAPIGRMVAMRAARHDGIRVEVTNSNPAHLFPGERHNRVLMLRCEALSAAGAVVRTSYHTIRAPMPFGLGRKQLDIAAGGTYVHTFPAQPDSVRISLVYKAVPWILHSDAEILHEVLLRYSDAGAQPGCEE